MSREIFILFLINIFAKISTSLNIVENGCSAYNCRRTCLNSNLILQNPGDNGFKLEIEGIQNEKYVPEQVYKG